LKTSVAGWHMVNFRVVSDLSIIPKNAGNSDSYLLFWVFRIAMQESR